MRIGIIGGSSQVGSSLALYLKHFSKEEVVCFVRSGYSNIFFELFDIPFARIDLNNSEQLKQQLSSFDAIIDCSYPAGQLFEILPAIRKNFNAVIPSMKKEAVFIYMSSIMAYGMPAGESRIGQYAIPRSSYAYIKRGAERAAMKLCKQHGIKGYNFRLSQVHGFLQSVNASFREKLSGVEAVYIKGSEQDLTNTIFINAVCEAVIKCVRQEVVPGLYTLVAEPQWTLQELYTYYTSAYNPGCKLVYFQETGGASSGSRWLVTRMIAVLKRFRPLLETYILMKLPGVSVKFKGRYRQSEVFSSVHAGLPKESIDFNLLGKPPLAVIPGIKSSLQEVKAHEKTMQDMYNKIIAENRK